MKLIIDIGHQKERPGAVGTTFEGKVITEFDFNEEIAKKIRANLGIKAELMYRRSYSTLPYDINMLKPDFIVSLHCNAFNKQVSGTEVLYWHASKKGEILASCMQKSLLKLGLQDRGIKPLNNNDRGSLLVKDTYAPCVICEPFFIDNQSDLAYVLKNKDILIDLYIEGIYAYINKN